jgi:predicted permease
VLTVLTLLAPIFLLIALGAALQRGGLIGPEVVTGINRLLYWVGLPAAVFHSLATASQVEAAAGGIVLGLALGTVGVVLLVLLLARVIGVETQARGTFLQAGFRGNLSFIGLPLLLAVPAVPQTAAVLALAPALVLYNGIAVAGLVFSQSRRVRHPGWIILAAIVRNPIIISSLLGWAWHTAAWPLTAIISRTLGSLASMALPLALLTVGAALVMPGRPRGNWSRAWITATCKTVLSPLVGYLVCRLLGLGAGETLTVLLCMTCPTAAVSYTMARQLEGDDALAAAAIVTSTLLALPALTVVLMLYGI